MSQKLKGEERVTWQNKLRESKKEGWYFLIGKDILIRRIPYNYEVITREHCISNYFGTLKEAVKRAIECAIELKLAKVNTLEEVRDILIKLEKLVTKTLEGVKDSLHEYDQIPVVPKSKEGRYYCIKCNKWHDPTKKKGQMHKEFDKALVANGGEEE